MITVKANLTFKDFLNYNFYKYFKSYFNIILYIFVAVIEIIWISSLIFDFQINSTLGLVSGACLVQYGIITPLRIYFSSKKEFKSKKEFHGPIEIKFTDEGINSQSNISKNFVAWDRIENVVETEKLFIFYYSKYSATLLPKRSFENNEHLQNFKELLKRTKIVKIKFL